MKIFQSRSLLKTTVNSFIRNNSKLHFSSHLRLVKQRDQELADKVVDGACYTTADFSIFLRVLNKNPGDKKLIDRFIKDLPEQIEHLDYLDARKAISIVLANPTLHQNEQIVNLLKNKFTEIRSQKGIDHFSGRIKIGGNLSSQPLSVRFWAFYANYRERFYMYIRKQGLNIK